MGLSEILISLRKEKGLTQEQLGKELGLSKGTIYQYENGKREPNFKAMKKLENFFGVSSSYLRGETNYNDYDENQDVLLETLSMHISGLERTSGFLKELPQEEQLEAYTFIDNSVGLLMNQVISNESILEYLDTLNGFVGGIQRFRQLLEQAVKNKANLDVNRVAEKYSREYFKNLCRFAEIYGFENNRSEPAGEYTTELDEPPISAVKEDDITYLPVFNLRMIDDTAHMSDRVNHDHNGTILKPVPIKGDAAAGCPIEIFEDEYGFLMVDQKYARYNSFVVRVRGESMINADILPGDYAVIRPQPTVENGEIALVNIDGNATIKFFYKKDGRYELRSANPSYSPLIYKSNEKLRILGKVVDVVKRDSAGEIMNV